MTTKTENLTEEQKKAIKKLGAKFLLKNLLVGVNYGAMLLVANVLTVLIFTQYAPKSQISMFLTCIGIDMLLINMMRSAAAVNEASLKEQVKKITDK